MSRRGRARGGLLALVCTLLSLPMLGAGHGIRAAAATTAVTANPVLAWGDNAYGEAGNDGSGDQQYCCQGQLFYNDYPVVAQGLTGAIAVSAGLASSAAIVQGHGGDGSPDPMQNTVWTRPGARSRWQWLPHRDRGHRRRRDARARASLRRHGMGVGQR